MFTSIVVPVDLSELEISKLALDRAATLSAVANAPLHLVYVRSILPITFMEYVPPSFDEEQQADCEKRMKDLVASLTLADKSKVTTAVRMVQMPQRLCAMRLVQYLLCVRLLKIHEKIIDTACHHARGIRFQ